VLCVKQALQGLKSSVLNVSNLIQMPSVKSVFDQNLKSNVLNVSGKNQKSRVARVPDTDPDGIENANSVLLQSSAYSGITPRAPSQHQPYVSLSKTRKAARGKPPGTIQQPSQATTSILTKSPRPLHQTRLYYPPKWTPHSNESLSSDSIISEEQSLDNAIMQEGGSSTTEAPALFSTAESPSKNEVTITTPAVNAPFLISMQDYRLTRHILFVSVIMEFDISIPLK
jgi:hypothetical protein